MAWTRGGPAVVALGNERTRRGGFTLQEVCTIVSWFRTPASPAQDDSWDTYAKSALKDIQLGAFERIRSEHAQSVTQGGNHVA